MADQVGTGPANGQQQQQQQQGTGILGMIVRGVAFYYLFTTIFKGSTTGPAPVPAPSPGEAGEGGEAVAPAVTSGYHSNLFLKNDEMYLEVYMSEKAYIDPLKEKDKLIWREDGLTYTSSDENNREMQTVIEPTEHLYNNGSMYLHIFLTREGKKWVDLVFKPRTNELSSKIDGRPATHSRSSSYVRYPVVQYMKKPKDKKLKNLLSESSDEGEAVEADASTEVEATPPENPRHFLDDLEEKNDEEKNEKGDFNDFLIDALTSARRVVTKDDGRPIVSFWSPAVDIQVVEEFGVYATNSLPPQLAESLKFHPSGQYYPPLYLNKFWQLKDKMIQINETVKELPLNITFSTLSNFKFQLYHQMEKSFDMQQSFGSMGDEEIEEMKRMFLETNPLLLGVTVIVSALHSIFDFLAFKNDIAFWKNNKSMEGLSGKTILVNAVSQFVIFLYLLDNETSWLIIISSAVGLGIEVWKIKKAFIVTVDRSQAIPWIKIEDRGSYKRSKTKEYDEIAMKYLSYILFPLIFGYTIYSLYYETHRSWYSFIISTLVGCVYTFGFIMMTPQLFINYKMKSVAHLPWKVFMYKALNTFIDDLFAFIIKMPTLHRLSCFRDDMVFLVYLYQRWAYPVDKTRVNEFGQVFEEGENGEGTAEERENSEEAEESETSSQAKAEEITSETAESADRVSEATSSKRRSGKKKKNSSTVVVEEDETENEKTK